MYKIKLKTAFLKTLLVIAVVNCSVAAPSSGQFRPPEPPRGIFSFTLENDVWLKLDEGYTNGLNFAWISPVLNGKEKSSFLKFFYGLNRKILGSRSGLLKDNDEEKRFVAFSLHQAIFTPEDLSKTELITGDRPYAGLLAVNTHLVRINHKHQDVFGLTTGLVGPHSFSEKAQTWLHETYDWTRPRGWKNQLKDEPVLDLWFSRVWLLYGHQLGNEGLNHGFKFGLNAQLGNLLTSAGAMIEFNLGLNFRPELEVFSPAPLFNSLSVGRVEKFCLFGFLRMESRVVVRNLLLEGNTFITSPGVKINRFYGQITTGLGYRNAFSAARFYLVLRNKEFQGQKYYDPYIGLTVDINL